jgi:ATP-dependent DNA helicase PIF1
MCTLQELFSVNSSPVQCREQFAQVLLHCDVTNATQLFAAFAHHFYDDQTTDAHSALVHIDSVLRSSNHSVADYGFDAVNPADYAVNRYNRHDTVTHTRLAAELSSLCTMEQATALEAVRSTLESGRSGQNVFIVAGPAGTGKTLWTNALTATLRSQGSNVMCVASSALAASLMLEGKTAHSALRIPIPAHEDSFCSWDAHARKELRKIQVLIWDEMSMINKNVANVVDASFRDLHCSNIPFGGITVVFVGDFQQLPPVVPRGKGEYSTIKSCDWFKDASKTTFTCNWRAAANPEYARWLECIGNGTETQVRLPHQCSCESAEVLIQRVYGNVDDILERYSGRMILSLTVADTRVINEMVINMIPGVLELAAANDKIPVQDTVPPEYVAGLTISGVPEFTLPMKIGARYMILKNYQTGVCNGVLCILKAFSRYIAQVQLLTGPRAGSIVPLPRVTFNVAASTSGLPFDFVRIQFPITLAYCVTVHKAQGQTLHTVGLYFTGETFAHGQLYVALSRVGSWERICATRINFENIVCRFLVS